MVADALARAIDHPVARAIPPQRLPLLDAPAPRAIAALTSRCCRWPLGEIADDTFAFCCVPVRAGRSYCPAHLRRATAGAAR